MISNVYPTEFFIGEGYPTLEQFLPDTISGAIGRGVVSRADWRAGQVIARFTGWLSHEITQHTLQVTPQLHIHDPWFSGLLTHSCSPNAILDMNRLELLALRDIASGEILTIDYTVTEDKLFKQFPCHCGSADCRQWITGRREEISEEGRQWIAAEHSH